MNELGNGMDWVVWMNGYVILCGVRDSKVDRRMEFWWLRVSFHPVWFEDMGNSSVLLQYLVRMP